MDIDPPDFMSNWTSEMLSNHGFIPVPRVSIRANDLNERIAEYPILGIPLVVEGIHEQQQFHDANLFIASWYMAHGQQELDIRDVNARTDHKVATDKFFEHCRASSAGNKALPTLYAKDAECPKQWYDWVTKTGVIPSDLIPLGTDDAFQFMPESIRPETIMCYLGTGGTYTPCHKDLCASSGQNLMVYTEGGGSSFWLMTKSSDAYKVAIYFQRELKQLIDWENHTVTLDELQRAPFDVYFCEQKLGDFVLVPPRSCHQVVNQGGLTIKLAWSRMTIKGLETALFHEVPLYRRVCRKETYCVKSMIWHTLIAATKDANTGLADPVRRPSSRGDLPKLAELLRAVLVDEFHPEHAEFRTVAQDEAHADAFSCDYCHCDIFISFFECGACPGHAFSEQKEAMSDEDVHLCPGCVAEGRSCACARPMTPTQRFPYISVIQTYNEAMRTLQTITPSDEWREIGLLGEPCALEDRELGLFKGAVALTRQKLIRRPNAFNNCYGTTSRTDRHEVQAKHAVPCKACHIAICYQHWAATSGIHSSEIALVRQRDANEKHEGKLWHKRHQQLKQLSLKGGWQMVAAADAEGKGLPLPLVAARLAQYASDFPFSQRNERVQSGFYDSD